MSVEIICSCSKCGDMTDKDDIICKRCYGDLEDEIYDLKNTIKELEKNY